MHSHKQVLLVAQKNASEDDPGLKDIFSVGTIATILQLIRLPDGTVKVLVEGVTRARIRSVELEDDYFQSQVMPLHSDPLPDKQSQLLLRSLLSQFDQYVQLSRKIPPEVMSSI